MSSSDGQRFPVRGKSNTARQMTIHGGQVLSTYTHVSDQHSTFAPRSSCRPSGKARDSRRPPIAPEVKRRPGRCGRRPRRMP
ncbi:MAG TPA: hypothetical protein VE196_12240 [Pseudonocardiaceae bacterium]|nr:hypothetical protein [Pseudonocardiaceae bacterium]